MSETAALQGFLDKWRARWPEWVVGEVFVPAPSRPALQAWLSLRDELAEAAWGGEDPRPGDAKLAWWDEELRGWAKGARRHPLGQALQKQPVDWGALAGQLPALVAARGAGATDAVVAAVVPFATAACAIADRLFPADGPLRAASPRADAASLLAERLLREAGEHAGEEVAAAAARLLAAWPAERSGPRPMRVHRAFVRRRLQRSATGEPPQPGRFAILFDAWRAARG